MPTIRASPILFYQFDLDRVQQNQWKLYRYGNMICSGDRCTEQEDLVHLIKDYAENGFQEKQKYAEMRKEYFAYIDHNNCQRTYEYIKSQGY